VAAPPPGGPAAPVVVNKIALADDEDGATGVMKRDQDPALAAVIAKVTEVKVVEDAEGKKVEMKVERYKGPEPLSRKILALVPAGLVLVAFSRFAAGRLGYGMVIAGFACVIFAAIRLFPRLRLIEQSYDAVLEVANEAKMASANDRHALIEERAAAQSAAQAAITDGQTKDAEITRLQGLVDNSVPKAVAGKLVRRNPLNIDKYAPTKVEEVMHDGTFVSIKVDDPERIAKSDTFLHWRMTDGVIKCCWLESGKSYSFGDDVVVNVRAGKPYGKVIRRRLDKVDSTVCPMNKVTQVPNVGEIFFTRGDLAAANKVFGSGGVNAVFSQAELELEQRTLAASTGWVLQAFSAADDESDDTAAKKKG
jgi:hypothetical protein